MNEENDVGFVQRQFTEISEDDRNKYVCRIVFEPLSGNKRVHICEELVYFSKELDDPKLIGLPVIDCRIPLLEINSYYGKLSKKN